MPRHKSGVLVIVELGADWPATALESVKSSGRRVFAQLEGEKPAVFASRVGGGLEQLFASGVSLSLVALACNERLDADAAHARDTIARAVLGLMATRRTGRVQFTAPASSSERLRRELTRLSRVLGEEWQSASLRTSTHFGTLARPRGGIALEVA